MGERDEVAETPESKEGLGFVAANGKRVKNDGRTRLGFWNQGKRRSMGFHVTEVTKPLAAVSRITEKGNKVVFGSGQWDSYIENEATGERMYMKKENGTYYIEAEWLGDDKGKVLGFKGRA